MFNFQLSLSMKKILFILTMFCAAISINAQNSLLADRLHLYVEGLGGAVVDKPDFANCRALSVAGGAITAGYQLTDALNIGLGTSPTFIDMGVGCDGWVVPVYAQARFDNTINDFSPYGEVRMGASIPEKGESSFYLNGSIGLRYRGGYIGIFYTEDINDGHLGYIGGKIGIVL